MRRMTPMVTLALLVWGCIDVPDETETKVSGGTRNENVILLEDPILTAYICAGSPEQAILKCERAGGFEIPTLLVIETEECATFIPEVRDSLCPRCQTGLVRGCFCTGAHPGNQQCSDEGWWQECHCPNESETTDDSGQGVAAVGRK